MASPESVEQRFNLITRRMPAEDLHGVELIKAALTVEGKAPKCLWGAFTVHSIPRESG
jgi:hypothetical protein